MADRPPVPTDFAAELEFLRKEVRRVTGTARVLVKARIYELRKQMGIETRYRTGGFKDRTIPPDDR
jgi:hypothetical protein